MVLFTMPPKPILAWFAGISNSRSDCCCSGCLCLSCSGSVWLGWSALVSTYWSSLATMLAPTDAALGKPMVTNQTVPAATLESLNVESGLNDGICGPILVILLGLAIGTQIEGDTVSHVIRVVAKEIGIGLAVGGALTGGAALLLRWGETHDSVSEDWTEVSAVALACACFAAAQRSVAAASLRI
ncbi:MAG: cation:proton antiporter [Methylocella sp.]